MSPSAAHVSHAGLATVTLDKKILTLAWGLLQLRRPDNGSRRLVTHARPERSAWVSTSQIELSNVDRAAWIWMVVASSLDDAVGQSVSAGRRRQLMEKAWRPAALPPAKKQGE